MLRSKQLSSFKFYNQGVWDQFGQAREVSALEVVPNSGDQKYPRNVNQKKYKNAWMNDADLFDLVNRIKVVIYKATQSIWKQFKTRIF